MPTAKHIDSDNDSDNTIKKVKWTDKSRKGGKQHTQTVPGPTSSDAEKSGSATKRQRVDDGPHTLAYESYGTTEGYDEFTNENTFSKDRSTTVKCK